MKEKGAQLDLRSLIWNLTSKVRFYGAAIFILFGIVNAGIFLKSSHNAACSVIENKLANISGPLGRELMIGDLNTAGENFKTFKRSLKDLNTWEDLSLTTDKSDIKSDTCTSHFLRATVNFPIMFGNVTLGTIRGNISYFSTFNIVLMAFLSLVLVWIGIRLLSSKLSKELHKTVVTPMQLLSQGKELPPRNELPVEVLEIERNIQTLRQTIQDKEREAFNLMRSKALGEQAERLAHDIISPLNALNSIVEDLNDLDSQRKHTLRLAINRIQEITRGLIGKSRETTIPAQEFRVSTLIDNLITEKQVEYKLLPQIRFQIKNNINPKFDDSFSHPDELKRVLSNLINNSVEAIETTGSVIVSCKNEGANLVLEVSDNGQGIPEAIIPRLMNKGSTFNKPEGSGLGLYYAKKVIESWNGSINIESSLSSGTTIQIKLPINNKAVSDLQPKSGVQTGAELVLIDNDELTRLVWETAAKADGVALKSFASAAEFFECSNAINREVPIYIDSDLGNGIKGEYVAQNIAKLGFKSISLATGFNREHFPPLPWISEILPKTPAWRKKGVQYEASGRH